MRAVKNNRLCLWLALLLLMLAQASCHKGINTSNHGKYPRHRHARNDDRGRHGHDDNDKQNAGDDWKTLNIKLRRGDNKALYAELKRWLGTPYKYAAQECGVGTDCSGMVMMVYRNVYNIDIERNSARIFEKNCKPVKRNELQEADLVFFNNGKSSRITHVGIYLRDNKFVHASSSRGVMVSDLNQNYWVEHFQCAGRIL